MSKEAKEATTEKKVTRRSMLQWTAGLAAAAVVGAGVGYGASELTRPPAGAPTTTTITTTAPPTPPLSFKPPLSAEVKDRVDKIVKDLINKHAGETSYYNLPGVGGAVKFRVKDGVLKAIESDDLINSDIAMEDKYIPESAIMKGLAQWRGAVKDRSLRSLVYNPARALYPMKRVSAERDMNAKFVRVSWDEALETVASKMREIKDKYGQYSIVYNPLMGWQECGVGTWGCPSNEGNAQASRWMLGSGWGLICGASYSAAEDITNMFHSKLVVLWGSNPTVTAGGLSIGSQSGWIYRLAREKGIPIIIVDPRYTDSCEVLADQWIPIAPRTDMAMLLAMANVLFKEDLYDKAYVEKFVEPTGFAKWRDYVLGKTPGPDGAIDRTPEWAEGVCGVPAETIREFTRLYAKTKPVYFVMTFAASGRHPLGDLEARASMIIHMMTGNFGTLGGFTAGAGSLGGGFPGVAHSTPGPLVGPIPLRAGVNKEVFFAGPPTIPWLPRRSIGTAAPTFYNPPSPDYPGIFLFWRLPDAILLREKLDKGEITKERYLAYLGAKQDAPTPNIKMAFFSGGGVINDRPEINAQIRAYKKLEFIVAIADSMWRPDARMADIVLPTNIGEVPPDIPGGFTVIRNYLGYQPKLIQGPGEVRPSIWINLQLAKRLGFGEKYASKLVDVTWDKFDATLEQLDKEAYERWAQREDVKALVDGTIPSWDEFRKTNLIKLKMAERPVYWAFKDQIEGGKPFFTDSGKIEFAILDPAKLKDWYGGGFKEYTPELLPVFKPNYKYYYTEEESRKYPIVCVSSHPKTRQHSAFDLAPYGTDVSAEDPLRSGDVLYKPHIVISVSDAKKRGIKDGDLVRVYNGVGEVLVTAIVSSTLTPGVACMSEGRWMNPNEAGVDRRGSHNTLNYLRHDPGTSEPLSHTIVEVEKF